MHAHAHRIKNVVTIAPVALVLLSFHFCDWRVCIKHHTKCDINHNTKWTHILINRFQFDGNQKMVDFYLIFASFFLWPHDSWWCDNFALSLFLSLRCHRNFFIIVLTLNIKCCNEQPDESDRAWPFRRRFFSTFSISFFFFFLRSFVRSGRVIMWGACSFTRFLVFVFLFCAFDYHCYYFCSAHRFSGDLSLPIDQTKHIDFAHLQTKTREWARAKQINCINFSYAFE